MSVVPMKMVTLAGPEEQLEAIIAGSIIGQDFQPVSPLSLRKGQQDLYAYEQRNPFAEPLNTAYRLAEELDIALEQSTRPVEALPLEQVNAFFEALSQSYGQLQARFQAQQKLLEDEKSVAAHLEEFQDLPAELNELRQAKYLRLRYGRLPKDIYEAFSSRSAAMEDLCIVPMGERDGFAYLVYVMPRGSEGKMDSLFKSIGFQHIKPPDKVSGSPQEDIAAERSQIAAIQQELESLQRSLAEQRSQVQQDFLHHYTCTRYSYEIYEIRKLAARTGDGFFILSGWMPAAQEDGLRQSLQAYPDVICSTEEPGDVKGSTPPVLLRHNLLGRIFKPFVSMYGLPAYNEFDPTVLMAVTYSILFGIMYGDLGQGLVLIALGAFLYKKKDMWLGRILCCVGVMASICGVIFGSVFGYEELIPGFHVLESGDNATRILIIAAAIGAVTIAFMMGLNIANGIRQHDRKKIFVTNNSVAGLVFYVGLLGGVVAELLGVHLLHPVYILLVLVLPLLVMFCQEPLGKLLAGEPDWMPESLGGFIMENFFEMFEVLLSYVTNTVSFLRVGAYAISHAGMMMVVYMLAQNDAGGYSVPIVVIGNIIVMGIEGLLVCIQVLRLEFYEMFGRFYGSGGVEFTPVVIDYQKKQS